MIPLTLGAEWALVGGDMQQLPPTFLSMATVPVLGGSSGGSLYGRWVTLECRAEQQAGRRQ
jgi:hypothetical protein